MEPSPEKEIAFRTVLTVLAGSLRSRLISRESLAIFADDNTAPPKADSVGHFDMDAYLKKYAFQVLHSKPWQSHAGGWIYELEVCPLNPDHKGGSAAFTMADGRPGFQCHHNGCSSKAIKDIFHKYPPDFPSAERVGGENGLRAGVEKTRFTQSAELIQCAAGVELFHTSETEAFGSFPVNDHREVWAIKSKSCRLWLMRAFYLRTGKPAGCQAMQDALSMLEAKALFDSPVSQVFTRIAPFEGRIYIDLGNAEWQVVEISCDGWRIIQNPPVRFRRSRSMQSMAYPAKGGSMSALRKLINVGDDNNWILLLCWLVAAFRPRGPYPLLILQGEQGSAKSTTAKLLRKLIDPASAPLRTPPRDERDLLIAANNSWVVAYDNLSGIPPWLSDALCRLSTGGGFSTRELYSDTDEVVLDLTRPVILNGIDHLAERPDLSDRAIILNLPSIDEVARRDEADLYIEYERECSQILGALIDAVSVALARLSAIELTHRPRMADFALWSTAAEEGLGLSSGSFMSAYGGNRAEAVQETLESDPLSSALVTLIGSKEFEGLWNGTSGTLLESLNRSVDEGTKKSRKWPRTPRGLAGQLRRISTFMRQCGFEITFHRKSTGGARPITIRRISRYIPAATAAALGATSKIL